MQRSRRLHDLTSEGQLQLHRAEVEIRRGRLDAAAKCAEACYRKCADGVRDQVPLYVRAHAAAWRGRLSEARKLAGEGLRMARDARDSIFEAQCLLTLGFTELSAGNYEAACGHESELKDMAARTVYGHPGAFRWHADAVESFVAFGQVDEARAVSVALWRDADRLNLPGCKALAARCDGLIHAQAGDFKLAEDSLLQSLSLMDGLEMPLERARSLLALGVVRRRARQKAAATSSARPGTSSPRRVPPSGHNVPRTSSPAPPARMPVRTSPPAKPRSRSSPREERRTGRSPGSSS